MKKYNVIRVTFDKLIEDPDNPNKMSDDEFTLLVRAIETVGDMLQPILIKKHLDAYPTDIADDYLIVDGHHRARAAKQAGLTDVMAVVWDGTEEMRQALQIGMNRIRGDLDLSAVARTVASLAEAGWSVADLTLTGFNESELTDLLASMQPDGDLMDAPLTGPDESPPEDKSPKPFLIELLFASKADFQRAKKALKSAAGASKDLGEGLLHLLDEIE